jgi:hypothetical protein
VRGGTSALAAEGIGSQTGTASRGERCGAGAQLPMSVVVAAAHAVMRRRANVYTQRSQQTLH